MVLSVWRSLAWRFLTQRFFVSYLFVLVSFTRSIAAVNSGIGGSMTTWSLGGTWFSCCCLKSNKRQLKSIVARCAVVQKRRDTNVKNIQVQKLAAPTSPSSYIPYARLVTPSRAWAWADVLSTFVVSSVLEIACLRCLQSIAQPTHAHPQCPISAKSENAWSRANTKQQRGRTTNESRPLPQPTPCCPLQGRVGLLSPPSTPEPGCS